MPAANPKPRVVVATANLGKVRELAAALGPLGFELVPQGELGIAPAAETGTTFLENAIGKARHAAAGADLPAIGDDSGLVVPALAGAPGIRSARYAGDDADDGANNAKLLAALADGRPRAAHFYCALAFLRHAGDPAPAIATGRWDGRIVATAQGRNGFGYDPYFFVPEARRTAAELSLAEKNQRSHRGQACRRLAAMLAPGAQP